MKHHGGIGGAVECHRHLVGQTRELARQSVEAPVRVHEQTGLLQLHVQIHLRERRACKRRVAKRGVGFQLSDAPGSRILHRPPGKNRSAGHQTVTPRAAAGRGASKVAGHSAPRRCLAPCSAPSRGQFPSNRSCRLSAWRPPRWNAAGSRLRSSLRWPSGCCSGPQAADSNGGMRSSVGSRRKSAPANVPVPANPVCPPAGGLNCQAASIVARAPYARALPANVTWPVPSVPVTSMSSPA